MVGKLFIVGLLCVALVQGEDDLGSSVNSALYRLKGMRDSTASRINAAITGVEARKKAISARTAEFIQREVRLEGDLLRSLERLSLVLEEKAGDDSAALECIQRAKATAAENIKSLRPKFEEDMKRLERTKLENIDTAAKPFPGIKTALQSKYQTAETDIKNCKTSACVNQVLARASRDFNALTNEVRRITNNISIIFNNFSRDSSTFLTNTSRQATTMQVLGMKKMRECVSRRDDFFDILMY